MTPFEYASGNFEQADGAMALEFIEICIWGWSKPGGWLRSPGE